MEKIGEKDLKERVLKGKDVGDGTGIGYLGMSDFSSQMEVLNDDAHY